MSEHDITRVLGGIYVGGVQPIVDHLPLMATYNITHILSIIKFTVIPEYLVRKSYTLKNIPIDDTEDEDVLQYFNETNTFIDHCLFPNEIEYDPNLVDFKKKPQHGAIYIHCQAGISRSPTFIIAYLMYRYGLTLKMALYAVKRKRLSIEPNENFMEQLTMFEKMGGKYVNDQDKSYKQWKLNKSIKSNPIDNNLLSQDETYTNIDETLNDLNNLSNDQLSQITAIRCKKCRQRLALSTSFINHTPPSKESSEGHFIRRAGHGRRIIDIQESQSICSHYFTEPLNWMKNDLQNKNNELEGKLDCPNCHVKVGGYNWKGSRCSCGKWVVPAIHLLANKVDKFPLKPADLPNKVDFKS
ncbi:tyrosine-protein phosphatase Yvh1p [Monosporozyma unispora]